MAVNRGPKLNAASSKILLEKFRSRDAVAGKLSFLKNREDWLEAASRCIRLLICSETDPVFELLADKNLGDCAALDVLRSHRKNLQELDVRVVGVHFLDQYAGRVSRIWPVYGWPDTSYLPEGQFEFLQPCKGEEACSDAERDRLLQSFTYGWIYSHLWMRAYWSILRTTTTLINAFHENILGWNDALYFCWEKAERPSLGLEPVIHFSDSQHEQVRQIAKEFAAAIHSYALADSNIERIRALAAKRSMEALRRSPEYRELVSDITRDVQGELERRGILARFRQAAEQLRFATLASDDKRQWYFNVLESVSSDTTQISEMQKMWMAYGKAIQDDEYMKQDVGIWSNKVWLDSLWQIEALYSSVMSGYSFTGESGLWVQRVANSAGLQAFAIIGFGRSQSSEGDSGNGSNAPEVMESLSRDLSVLFAELSRAVLSSERLEMQKKHARGSREEDSKGAGKRGGRASASGIVADLVKRVRSKAYRLDPAILEKWLRIVINLSEEAVHEKKEIRYLLGCGPAYLSRVRSRLFEPAPEHLEEDAEDEAAYAERVVHFLKSYHSIFGDQRRICWFDPLGHFRGIYESADGEMPERWFVKWDPVESGSYLIASISGRGQFDIMDRDGAVLARFRSGELRTPTGKGELRDAVDETVRELLKDFAVFIAGERSDNYLKGMSLFVSQLVARLQELAAGTSLVVVLDESAITHWSEAFKWSAENDPWRLPLESQVRRLAPNLKFYQALMIETRDIIAAGQATEKEETREKGEALVAPVIEKLVPLAKIDGATILRILSTGITCSPANQLIPLIDWSSSESSSESGALADSSKEIASGLNPKRYDKLRPLDIFDPPNPEDVQASDLPIEKEPKSKRLSVNQVRKLADLLLGHDPPDSNPPQQWYKRLTFLNSSGTRHHSLWGITVTAREPLFAFTLSEDGHLRLFCDGRPHLD